MLSNVTISSALSRIFSIDAHSTGGCAVIETCRIPLLMVAGVLLLGLGDSITGTGTKEGGGYMLLAVCAITLAVLLHVVAARIASRENDGRRLPTVNGSNPVRPGLRARRAQAGGWILSIVGALQLGDRLWLTEPWLAMGVVVAVLLLVNGLPSLIVTVLHNGNLRTQP